MSLPSINKSRFQRAINDIEFEADPSSSVLNLAEKIAGSSWNVGLQLQPKTIAKLIVLHRPQCTCEVTDQDLIDFADDGKDDEPVAAVAPEPVQPKVVTTYDEPGKGRKACPTCQKYVGIRTMVCVCGHDFKAAPPVKAEPTIVTYDEAGPRRKECPSCKKFVGYSAPKCACGHEFAQQEAESESTIVTYDEAGPRRKECPSCNKFVGYSAPKCACGHEFSREETKAVAPEEQFPIRLRKLAASPALDIDYVGGNIKLRSIYVPCGGSPHRLQATDFQSVEEWVQKVYRHFATEEHARLSIMGYCYLARQFYDADSADYPVVRQHICEVFGVAL